MWGCGVFWHSHWIQISWAQLAPFSSASIIVKEMLPIIVAACRWGQQWRGCLVQCNCDTAAAISALISGVAKDRHLAHMLHCLFFLQAKFNLCLQGHHIPGTDNITADALSRNRMDLFSSSNPHVDADPTLVPLEWPAFLLDPEEVWTSQRWTNWFETILQHALAPTTQCSYTSAQHRY